MLQRGREAGVDGAIREQVADLLADGRCRCVGRWEGDDLVAFAAWTSDRRRPEVWVALMVGVRVGFHRKGYGRSVKEELLRFAARADGVEFVRSTVHRDNRAMLRINEALGAELIVEGRRDEYVECLIDVSRR